MPKVNKPSSAVAAAMRKSQSAPKSKLQDDTFQRLQSLAANARDLELEIESQEQALKEKKADLESHYKKYLPDLMDLVGVDAIGVPPQGNKPGKDFKLRPYFSASIAARWPDEKRQEAFQVLKNHKAETLIKTEVIARLPKGSLKKAQQLIKAAKLLSISMEMKESVHSSTLKAWLKEIYDKGQSLTLKELEKIGGSVGRTCQPKDREQED